MSLRAFLYRRLARWITCELGVDGGKIALQSKYDVASFQDVFCHPFYWQMYNHITRSPGLVVDCGANCGHFSILAELCCRAKFRTMATEYLLVEPNPHLIPAITNNLRNAGLSSRASVKQALLGSKRGTDILWINKSNYLAASTSKTANSRRYEVPYLNLSEEVAGRPIDLMKIDIEGSEFRFVRSNPELFQKVRLLFMEVHDAPAEEKSSMFSSLESAGLTVLEQPIDSKGFQLVIFGRK